MHYCPNCRHGKESCQCKQDISYGIEEAINTLRVADLQIKQAQSERQELVNIIIRLLATTVAAPDCTAKYNTAYHHAQRLIDKYKS